jgi:hypothetical protein
VIRALLQTFYDVILEPEDAIRKSYKRNLGNYQSWSSRFCNLKLKTDQLSNVKNTKGDVLELAVRNLLSTQMQELRGEGHTIP